jgi:hypothetical protein
MPATATVQVPFLDLRTFFERHLPQVAGDVGADVHRVDGVGAPGEIDVVGDLPADRLADRDRRRLGRGGLGLAARTTYQRPCGVEALSGLVEELSRLVPDLSVPALARR